MPPSMAAPSCKAFKTTSNRILTFEVNVGRGIAEEHSPRNLEDNCQRTPREYIFRVHRFKNHIKGGMHWHWIMHTVINNHIMCFREKQKSITNFGNSRKPKAERMGLLIVNLCIFACKKRKGLINYSMLQFSEKCLFSSWKWNEARQYSLVTC